MSQPKSLSAKSDFVLKQSSKKRFLYAVPVVILVIFAAAIAFDKLFVPQPPIGPDVGLYAVVAHELLDGRTLYVDVWDHKPPVIFVTYAIAEAVFGYSAQTVFLLQIFANIFVLIGVFYAGKAGRGGIITGLLAALLWVLVSGSYQIESHEPNTEIFINACVVWAFALLAKERENGLPLKTVIIISLLFLLGSFYKPVVVAHAGFLAFAHIFSPPGGLKNRQKAVSDVVKMSAVGCAGWVLSFLYFAFTNRLDIYYKTIISYNSFYSGNLLENIISPLQRRSEILLDFMNPLALFAVTAIFFLFFRSRRQSALLTAYLAGTWVAVALPGQFYSHYYQLWLPPLIVGAAWAVGHFAFNDKMFLRVASILSAFCLLAYLVLYQIPFYKSAFDRQWLNYSNPQLLASAETAEKINGLLKDEETFFIFGNTPNLYFITKREPPVPVFFSNHLDESPVSDFLRNRTAEDLTKNKPEILITEGGKMTGYQWIDDDYELIPVQQNDQIYKFYMRRGGRIANAGK